MDIQNTKLEHYLKSILLRSLNITIKNKSIKKGKLLLFRQNGFTIDLYLNYITPTKTKMIICNLPIPFAIKQIDAQNTYFDYKLMSIANNNSTIKEKIIKFSPVSKNKFYDTIVNIQAV